MKETWKVQWSVSGYKLFTRKQRRWNGILTIDNDNDKLYKSTAKTAFLEHFTIKSSQKNAILRQTLIGLKV